MASAQVLSKADVQRESGRRLLEEFKKKKAEGKTRKPASSGQQRSTEVSQHVAPTKESGSKRPVASNGAVTSEGDEPIRVVSNSDSKAIELSINNELGSSSETHDNLRQFDSRHNAFYTDSGLKFGRDVASKQYQGEIDHQEEEKNRYSSTYNGTQEIQTNLTDHSNGSGYDDRNIYQSSRYSVSGSQLTEDRSHLKEDSTTSHASFTSISPEKHSDPVQLDSGFASTSASGNASVYLNEVSYSGDSIPSTTSLAESFPRAERSNGSIFDMGRMKLSSSVDQEPSTGSERWKSSDSSLSSGYNFDLRSDSNHIPLNPVTSETGTRRNRPSFLDSLNVPRVSPSSHLPLSENKTEPYMSRSSIFQSADTPASSVSGQLFDKWKTPNIPDMHHSENNSVLVSTEEEMQGAGVKDSGIKWNHEFATVKQDENFATLEQHIEDLTQAKFSMERDLNASRALAESLATENSSLTDSYNQQRAAVNQLKSNMESLQEEIKAQMLELDSIKMEYANAQLECNAADERARILASEVIGLEEKALKLRSRELKLERELEKSNAEIISYRKKVSSLQKERQDLQSTIDALQEEKKLLQSKLRKAVGSSKSVEVVKTTSVVKNVSTSTEDLGFEDSELVRTMSSDVDTVENTSSHEMQNDAFLSSITSPGNNQLHFPVVSASIPPDQLRMIGSINSLISELALEKEELVRALSSESSQSSKLKDLNKELTRKLEAQTQRLELLTAQTMANENILGRPMDSRPVHDSMAYADEGDEVEYLYYDYSFLEFIFSYCNQYLHVPQQDPGGGREGLGLDNEAFPWRAIKTSAQKVSIVNIPKGAI
ncbi:hypothetical protein IFM89_016412 [Coptis chinensis]|uniref:Uncharacterized protein n=1 Tax=Coptis chinensis TaxID=261450 RepID=A0A835HCC2_9MAGN|nr:hypothetical protein IFM89_016412 [Coptis chinensis]